MLRSAANLNFPPRSLLRTSLSTAIEHEHTPVGNTTVITRAAAATLVRKHYQNGSNDYYDPPRCCCAAHLHQRYSIRTFAEDAGGSGGNNQNKGASTSNDSRDDHSTDSTKDIVLSPGQKVVAATRLTMWAGIAVFASACFYYISKELIPTKMSPNRVFDRSLEVVRADDDVKQRFGEPLKGYGRDHGGHREGRRNFIEHTDYTSEDDGTKRTRVRYNLEGRHGKAFVFAEVSADMSSGEFVYILVQDKSNGRVFTVVDNRAALTAARLSAGSKEAQSAMSQLLTGNNSSSSNRSTSSSSNSSFGGDRK